MNKKVLFKRAISALMSMVLIGTSLNSANNTSYVQAVGADTRTAIEAFKNPSATEKPMARMWFPDAYAGIDDNDTIAKQINALADAGFGGVEIAMLADGASFNNEDAATIGWGSVAWKELLRKTLKAANAIEGGFTVDITLTAHWPLTINNIDPNDEAASQEMTSTYNKISASSVSGGAITVSGGAIDITLPETDYFDQLDVPFIFTDKLVSVSVVRVDSVDGSGNLVLDYSSIKDVTDKTTTTGITSAAGIPDATALSTIPAYSGWNEDKLADYFGAAADPSISGKIDENGNRKRMADTQDNYVTDLSGLSDIAASEGDTIQAGDYILLSTFRRGTGQIFSDGGFGGYSVSMKNRCYVPNYFSVDGVNAVANYWNANILNDSELVSLLRENGSSIFEDSIELSHSSSFWTGAMMSDLTQIKGNDYTYSAQFPVVIAVNDSSKLSFNDTAMADKIKEDYNSVLGTLYEEEHSKPIRDFAATFGYTFRAQTYTLTGLDIPGAAATIDIPEGDNACKGDGLRTLFGTKNLADKTYLSIEGVTGMGNNALNWEDVLTEVSQNYSDGVNHVILHGTPYSKTYNGYNSSWPGWLAFGNCFSDSYSYRQAYWDDAKGLTTFMAKTQAVLQTADAKIDLAVLNDKSTDFELNSGNGFQTLLDNGYSYNILSGSLLKQNSAVVTNGVLDAEGAAYKALILNNITTISTATMNKLISYAQAGLPIYVYNCNISSIYGTDSATDSVASLAAAYSNLLTVTYNGQSIVKVVSNQQEVLDDLATRNLAADSAYNQSGLETTHYLDGVDGTDYYYLYNNTQPNNSGMVNPGNGKNFKTGEIQTAVTLKGTGTPYALDAATGTITPIASYTVNDNGTITVPVFLSGAESVIIAIAENIAEFPAAPTVHALCTTDGDVVYTNNQLVFKADEAGTYHIQLSDGTTKTVVVEASPSDYVVDTTGWTLDFTSYAPDRTAGNLDTAGFNITSTTYTLYKDPSATIRTNVIFNNVSLGDIGDISASSEQLTAMDIDSMKNVSGTGYYTKTISLPSDWDNSTGAILDLSYHRDEVTAIIVNGTDVGLVSNITDQVDIGKYLVAGQENIIKIKIATNLVNRTLYENPWAGDGTTYDVLGTGTGGKPVQLGLTSRNANGLTAVSLLAYKNVVLYTSVNGISLNKASISLNAGSNTTLKATITPADATNQTVSWSSSDSNIVTVNSNGYVYAKAAGTATITATSADGSKTATCVVTVVTPSGSGVVVTNPGTSTTPTPTPVPTTTPKDTDGSTNTTDSSTSTATTNNKYVTAKTKTIADSTNQVLNQILNDSQHGSVVAVSSKKTITSAVEVTASVPDATVGQKVYIYKLNATTKKLEIIVGGFSNRVSEDGIVTFDVLEKGTYVVLTTKAPTSQVTTLINQISIKPSKSKVSIGNTSSMKVDLPVYLQKVSNLSAPTKSDAIGNVKITYKSSDSKIASVNKNGMITAKKPGSITVTATIQLYNGTKKTIKTKITVK